jgi:diaminobutyrate-2-oxoglutarate transaminase
MPTGKSIGTFRGNMVAFAAGAAALNWMVDNQVPEYAAELGKKAMARFKEIEKNSKILGEARGIGLMIALEIVEDKKSRKPATDLTKMVRKLAHQRGVMIEVGGHHNNVARLLPPLIISEDLLMKAADVLEGVLKELE